MGLESIKEIKQEAKKRGEEVYYRDPRDSSRTIMISPLEQIRYEENSKLAHVLCDKLYDLLDGKVRLADIKDMNASISFLSDPQRKIINDVVNNISKAIEWKPTRRMPSLHSLYELHGKYQAERFFYKGIEHRGISQVDIPRSQISLTPLDAVLVHIADSSTWTKVVGNAKHAEDCEGFLKKYDWGGEVPHIMNDYPYINRQFERTVYINVVGKDEGEIKQIERHELFHDLYHQAIEPVQTSTYKSGPMHDWFVEMKNEIVAYVLAERWNTSLSEFVESSKKDIFSQKLFSRDDFLEILFVQRELGRLKLLKSKSFETALKATLTAQSFKEMVYNLSRIEAGVYPDALVLAAEPEEKWDVEVIDAFVYDALNMKLPVLHLSELIERIRNSHRVDEFKKTLSYYEGNQNRWLNPEGGDYLGFVLPSLQ